MNNMAQATPIIHVPKTIGKYSVLTLIGQGGFSKVVLGIDPKTKQKVAIKIYSRQFMTENNMIYFLENEIRLHSRFNHPNIVKIHEIIYEEEYIMIVMDYYRNGDLFTAVSNGCNFSLPEQISTIYQIVDAVNYLHQRGICIRDIKPENILFDDFYRPILIDFGLAKENGCLSRTICGTTSYLAPEVISSNDYNPIKADIWSLGVTIHIFCTKMFPWNHYSETMTIKQMASKNLEIDIKATGFIKKILEKCLVLDPEQRISAQNIISLFDCYQHQPLPQPIYYETSAKTNAQTLPKIQIRKNCFIKEISHSNFARFGERKRRILSKR